MDLKQQGQIVLLSPRQDGGDLTILGNPKLGGIYLQGLRGNGLINIIEDNPGKRAITLQVRILT
jgi:hypothetical protein